MDRDLSDLKEELKTDVHLVNLAELCIRFNTDLEKGKKKSEVAACISKHGQVANCFIDRYRDYKHFWGCKNAFAK